MHTLTKTALSALAGAVAFVLVGASVTEALAPYVWPSLMLGIPAGVVAGITTGAVAYLGLTARDERRDTGSVSTAARRQLWATLAAVLAGTAVGGLAVVVLATQAVGFATALLAGLLVGLVAAAVVAAVVVHRIRQSPPPETAVQ